MNQNISSRDDYEEHYTLSTTEPEKYWAQIAKSYDWKKEPQKIIQGDFNDLECFGCKINLIARIDWLLPAELIFFWH